MHKMDYNLFTILCTAYFPPAYFSVLRTECKGPFMRGKLKHVPSTYFLLYFKTGSYQVTQDFLEAQAGVALVFLLSRWPYRRAPPGSAPLSVLTHW